MTRFINFIHTHIQTKTHEAQHQITLFGIVMMINYPLFGVLWKLEIFQFRQEFFLRLMATILCAVLAFNQFWPRIFIKMLPLIWYFTLLFCLPFFFAYLTLLNNGSVIWLMNCVSAIFFMLLVTGALDALILMIIGVSIALICFFYETQHTFQYIPGNISMFSLIATYTAAIIIGVLFARDRENIFAAKLVGLQSIVDGLAQDLQTPLASIYLQTELQERMLAKLNDNPELHKDLKESLTKITHGIEMGNKLISMQLHHIQAQKLNHNNFAIVSIKPLLVQSLKEYPLKDYQKTWIQLDMAVDFLIWIEELAFKNIIWNFLKNSLDSIEKVGEGKIKIWMEVGLENDNYNYVYFKDTSTGKYTNTNQSKVKQGSSTKALDYCQSVMDVAGGSVHYKTYTREYVIKFPKVD